MLATSGRSFVFSFVQNSRRLCSPEGRQDLLDMELHRVRLIVHHRAILGSSAEEMELIRVPVVPIVTAAGHVEELRPRRAAVTGSAGRQVSPCVYEVPLFVQLPVRQVRKHPLVVGNEVLIADDQGRVAGVELTEAAGPLAQLVDLLENEPPAGGQRQHQRVTGDVRIAERLQRTVSAEEVSCALEVASLEDAVADAA